MAFFAWGIGFYGHGFYIVSLSRMTGWPTATLSAGVAIFWLANVVASLLLGGVVDRYGARLAILYGIVAMACGCFGLAAFDSGFLVARWQLFVVFALMGTAYPGLAALAISASLIPWFKQRLGLALGVGLSGASAGGAVMPPLMTYLMVEYGFGLAMAGIGVVLVLATLPIVAFVIRPPKSMEAAQEHGNAVATVRRQKPPINLLFTDTRFWLIALASSLSLGAQVGFLMHQIPLLQENLGLSGAAYAVSVAALSAAVGRFVLGALCGRIPLTWLALGCYLIQASGLVFFLISETPLLLYVASAIVGLVIGCIVMLPPLLVVEGLGAEFYGSAYGITGAAMFGMGSVTTAVSGWLYDLIGAYNWSLLLMLALHLAASLLILCYDRRCRASV